jgi:hypothetical protein
MAELIDKATMASILRDLQAAFPVRIKDDELIRRAAIYHDALVGFSSDALKFAAKRAVQEDDYFPKARRLRELAQQYVSYENKVRGDTTVGYIVDPMLCQKCHTRFEFRLQWRPKNPAVGNDRDFRFWETTADGQYLLLESHSDRTVCECGMASRYVPLPNVHPAVMPVSMVGFHMEFRRTNVVVEVAA